MSEGRRSLTVLLALAANLLVGLLKLAAGLITGSAALLSEAAHSVGDCVTEILLLVALRRSERAPDRQHPFGYGMERYFWSLMAAGAIFISGAGFSLYEGVHTITGGDSSGEHLWLNYPVLAAAFLLEGTSFLQALRGVRQQAQRRHRSLISLIRNPEDPTANSVALEDSAALVGIGFAAIGVALHQITGQAVWDGAASVAIGTLLLGVAYLLTTTCRSLLTGRQADPQLMRAIEKALEEEAEIVDVVDMLSMLVGTNRVLLCVRADFVNDLSAGQLEEACLRIDADLRERFVELDEIFIQPASRRDSALRARVQARYGHSLAD
ncbi:cation diffusion facilitator family transporter [Jatrophihabitans sp.]|uniref:cation diffusion facilitator family transporter n=1 Tax=Jatrophihabitans sp. TaxID=1932789 RepID=UPI0030C7478C|nr:Cation diffusion facilitator family transporter [Jatrophihabitans sp.]